MLNFLSSLGSKLLVGLMDSLFKWFDHKKLEAKASRADALEGQKESRAEGSKVEKDLREVMLEARKNPAVKGRKGLDDYIRNRNQGS